MSNILASIVIPCFNEHDYIKISLASLLNQTIDKSLYEIIVVDGFSDDGTREILSDYAEKFSNIFYLDNPKRITAIACNIGIKNAHGKFIAICGAHNTYNPDYLEKCLNLMQKYPDIDCVGGPVNSIGINKFSNAAALALSSFVGIGNARHRFKNTEEMGLISQYPFFRKSVFDVVGMYNEKLRLNEDDELFYRVKRAGIKTLISPVIKSTYFVRNNPQRLFKQFFNYGYWRWKVFREYNVKFAVRQLIPSIFIIALIILFVLGLYMRSVFVAITLPLLYILTLVVYSIITITKHGLNKLLYFPLSIIILHFSYGLGFIKSLFDEIIHRDRK